MKIYKYIFLLLILAQGVYAQVDRSKKAIPIVIPIDEAPQQFVSDSIRASITLEKKENDTPALLKSIDFTGSSRYVKPGFSFPSNIKKGLNPFQSEEYKAPLGDQFFGEITQNEDFVLVYCRDHEAIDGDRVSILVNGKTEVQDVFLTSGFRGFYIQLSTGFNKIEFLALNQGESGPNTAQFQVYDLNGHLLKDEKWNLATGYKAGFVVVKMAKSAEN